MDRNQAKEFYPILQAYAEGRVIESRTKPSTIKGTDVPNDWTEMKEIEYWNNIEYRVKPEPTYRPFANAEECWNEMKKHQPFGWLKEEGKDNYRLVGTINNEGLLFVNHANNCKELSFLGANKWLNFADGVPFGVKVEE